MEIILDLLYWFDLIAALAVPVYTFIKKAITGRESAPMRLNKPSKENHFGGCKAVQYIAKRNLLILQARQDARKRSHIRLVNVIEFYCVIAFLLIAVYAYRLLPWFKEAIDSLFFLTACFTLCLFFLVLLSVLTFFQMFFNAPSWSDLIKRNQDKYSIYKSRQEAIKEAIEEAIKEANKETEKTEKEANEETKQTEKEAIKEAVKEAIKKDAIKNAKKVGKKAIKEAEKRRCLHISQVIDVASHFNTYLLLDADSRETFLKDGVIGAKGINEGEPIRKVIESYLSENDTNGSKQAQGDVRKSAQTDKDTTVVFIYSRHGKASYERTKEARTMCKGVCKNVFDLGSVCDKMRDLEIVAHQLLYLQDEGCLNFLIKKN